MHLLLINYEYPPIGAGAANATMYIAQELVKLNVQVTVVTAGFQNFVGYKLENGVNVYRVRTIRKNKEKSNIFEMLAFLVSTLFFLPNLIRKNKINGSIAFFTFPSGPAGLFLKLFFKIPYVVSLRGGDVPGAEPGLNHIHRILKPLRHSIFKNSIAIVANSHGLKRMSEYADPFPVAVISNGIDTKFFQPIKKKINDITKILFVGRFQEQKNLFYLLKNLSLLKKKSSVLFTIEMVGDGPQLQELMLYAEKLKLSEYLVWHGWLDKSQLVRQYQHATCFINPSTYEGMPNTVLEAMACECPVIASRVPGNMDLIHHGTTGFLFNLQNPQKMIEACQYVIENPLSASKIGRKGRKMVEEHYRWKHAADNYRRLFIYSGFQLT